jgi:PAS domain S-box-containing protein
LFPLESALAASISRFEAAVAAVDGVMWTTNADGLMEAEQPGWTALTGQTYAQYRDGGGYLAVHPDDREATMSAWMASLAERRPFQFEHRLMCADGQWRRFSVRGVPVLDDGGEIREWVGVHTDVTQQRRREAELREREERLRAALEASGTGTFRWNIRTNELDWDDALDRLFGLRPGETARSLDQFLALVHSADRDEVIARCEACRDQGADFEMAFRVVQPTGEIRWLYDQGRTFADADGRPATMTGACVDITERRQVEDRLRESESRFRTVAEALPSFVFVANMDGENIYTNATYQSRTGLSADDLKGFGFLRAIHPQDVDMVSEVWRSARASARPYEVECRMRMADGAFRWHLGRGVPLAEADGQVNMWFGTVNDIQDLVDAREGLTRSNLELEAKVARRTEELAHLQKVESMGRLTGGIAHDFNNLLTPIIGGLDLLQRTGNLDDRANKMISGALQAAERARTLVSRLLAFARRQHLNSEIVDLAALVEGMRDLIDRSIGPTIKVEIKAAEGLPTVRIDPSQTELALLNLAVNARDAMPVGGVLTIELGTERLEPGHPAMLPPGDYVRLSVLDTGVGMDEATLSRAIDPFFSTKGMGEGTGLGLSMVHGLAAQSGGALVLSSSPGNGTQADVYLPGAPNAPRALRASPAGPGRTLNGLRVLLVDDDQPVRQTTADMLEGAGCIVRQAGSAAEALAMVEEGLRPDALVTDYLMPGMDGAELGRVLSRQIRHLPVLILSGYSRPSEMMEFPRLQKPYRSGELSDAVAGLFQPLGYSDEAPASL